MSSKNDAQTGSIANDRAPDGGVVVDSGSRDVRDGGARRGGRVKRRTFLKGVGATGAVAVGMGSRNGAVGSAAAIPPLAIPVAGFAAGWALREFEVLGSDSVPDGLGPETLTNQVETAAKKRKSNNKSTFIDNKNILSGIENVAYTDGKVAAIESLNAQKSESEVIADAKDAANSHLTTVITNYLKSWNESVNEVESFIAAESASGDFSMGQLVDYKSYGSEYGGNETVTEWGIDSQSYTLPDGTTFDVKRVRVTDTDNDAGGVPQNPRWSPTGFGDGDSNNDDYSDWSMDVAGVTYMFATEWGDLLTEMESVASDVSNGLETWVLNVYGEVQSGSIEISELITPRERAAMMEADEGSAQAIADLQALNLPIDVEREVTITLTEQGATLRGTLGLSSEMAIESGESYSPETLDTDIYLTYDVSQGSGTWDAYESGVDGGTVTFTSEPLPGVLYRINTAAGETATATQGDFSESSGSWSVDVSDQLETAITSVDSVEYYSEEEGTNYETVRLTTPFTVDKIENTETGEEETSLTFETTEPQTDSNYITQEEWDELEAKNEELIDKYENAQGGGEGLFGGGGLPSLGDAGPAALVAGVAVSLGAVGLLREIVKMYIPGK